MKRAMGNPSSKMKKIKMEIHKMMNKRKKRTKDNLPKRMIKISQQHKSTNVIGLVQTPSHTTFILNFQKKMAKVPLG